MEFKTSNVWGSFSNQRLFDTVSTLKPVGVRVQPVHSHFFFLK